MNGSGWRTIRKLEATPHPAGCLRRTVLHPRHLGHQGFASDPDMMGRGSVRVGDEQNADSACVFSLVGQDPPGDAEDLIRLAELFSAFDLAHETDLVELEPAFDHFAFGHPEYADSRHPVL